MPTPLQYGQIENLYKTYRDSLAGVRAQQMSLYKEAGNIPSRDLNLSLKLQKLLRRVGWYLKHGAILKPQLDDLEAEITYLLVRELKPDTMVEISPCGGWSTTWILSALRENGRGKLHSYDIVPLARRNVPKDLAEGRWHFSQGDVTQNVESIPQKIDYLFIDSDHSAPFAHWYIETVFPRVKPGGLISVHDVFHTSDPEGFDAEGKIIIDWLEKNQIPYFTPSRERNPEDFDRLYSLKRSHSLDAPVHMSTDNSMIFFFKPE